MMWIQLSDDALAKAAQILRAGGETDSAGKIERYLEDNHDNKAYNDKFREAAKQALTDEDQVDDDAVVSEGDDPGAYVMCWKWVRYTEAGLPDPDDYDDNGDRICDECGNGYPDTAVGTVNCFHKKSCSLHTSNVHKAQRKTSR